MTGSDRRSNHGIVFDSLWHFPAALQFAALLFVLALGTSSLLVAQVSSGSILGYVYDPSGASVPAADVKLQDASGRVLQSRQTGIAGAFRMACVCAGSPVQPRATHCRVNSAEGAVPPPGSSSLPGHAR